MKIMLAGILFCLIIIAFKSVNFNVTTPAPNVNVNADKAQTYVQVAPNRIGIVDSGIHTGYPGQLIIFDYDPVSKTFTYATTLKSSTILYHPEEYGIPIATK